VGQGWLKKVFCIAKLVALMSVDSEEVFPEKAGGPRKRYSEEGALWPRLIEMWLTAVIVAFFLIRVLGSQTAKRLLSSLGHSHFQ
jgi:hypothetical protein